MPAAPGRDPNEGRMLPYLSIARSFLRGALRRLPVETAIVTAAAVAVIAAIHGDHEHVWHLRVLLAALLAGPLVFALHERAGRFAISLGAAVSAMVMTGMVYGLPTLSGFDQSSFQWTYGLLLLASFLIPFIAAAPRFTTFVRRFFEEITIWGLLWGAAVLAIGVISYALHGLFDLRVEKVAADAALLTTAVVVLIVLDRLLPTQATISKMPEIWRRLATAIGAPFVAVMLLILIVYQGTVLASGELPRNLLSPLIIGAGFSGFLCTLILTAVAAEPVGSGALSPAEPHRFLRNRSVLLTRAFPAVLVLLLPMALWALYVRIDAYGLTPFRVVRMAALLGLGLLGVLGTVRWWRGRPPLGWQVPAIVALVALVISIGPISAVQLSIRSQVARLDALLLDNGIATHVIGPAFGEVLAEHSVSEEVAAELRDAISLLADLGGEVALRRVFSGEVAVCAERWSGADECLRRLRIRATDEHPAQVAQFIAAARGPIAMPSGQLVFLDIYSGTDGFEFVGDLLRVRLEDGSWATASLTEAIAAARESKSLSNRAVVLRSDIGLDAGILAIRQLEVRVSLQTTVELSRVEGVWVRP